MSMEHVKEALWKHTRDSDAKLVLVSMAFHANDQGLCCKPSRYIERDTQLDAGTLLQAIDMLTADGLLERHGTDQVSGATVWRLRL